MFLRKPPSSNSSGVPLKKNMDAFKPLYGLDDNNTDGPAIQYSSTSTSDDAGDASDNDYDSAKNKQKLPSPPPGILGMIRVPSLVRLSCSNSQEITAIPTTSLSLQAQQEQADLPLQQSYTSRTLPPRTYSSDSNHHNRKDNNNTTTRTSLPPPFVMQVTAIASLGGVLFGYDMGVIAGALPQLKQTFDLTVSQEELVVSILYVGGGLGAALGGTLCDFLGRKPAILWTDVTFMIGASVLFTAPDVTAVCIGRIIVGFAVAVSGIADVSYLHEIAPKEWRGAIVSVNEACISLGFLLAFIVGEVFQMPLQQQSTGNDVENNDGGVAYYPPRGWRYMFGLAGVLALIQFLGMWTMPESPVWLKDQGRHEESKAALRRIHGTEPGTDVSDSMDSAEEDGDDFVDEINGPSYRHESRNHKSHQEAVVESKTSYESLPANPGATSSGTWSRGPMGNVRFQMLELRQKVQRGWRKLKSVIGRYRRQVWIALFLSVTQQLCGQTSVLNYAPSILRAVVKQDNADGDGNDEISAGATLSIGLVKFVVTVLVIWKIESVGRRTLLLVGMGTIAFGLLLVAIAFSAQSPYGNTGVVQQGSGFYFAMPGVLLVVSGYSMSFGPLTWLLTSELFPTDIRGRALGASTIVTYLCAAMVTYSFLSGQSLLGTSTVFFIYMLITVAGVVFACMAIPDTGNKTLDEIDADLSNMPWWRRFGSRDSSADGDDEPKRWRPRMSSSSPSRNGSTDGNVMLDVAPAPSVLLRPNGGSGRLVEGEII
jgi:MFS family permease